MLRYSRASSSWGFCLKRRWHSAINWFSVRKFWRKETSTLVSPANCIPGEEGSPGASVSFSDGDGASSLFFALAVTAVGAAACGFTGGGAGTVVSCEGEGSGAG